MTQIRGNQLKSETITTDQIGDKQVTAEKIADVTITNDQVATNADIAQSKIDGLVDALANKLDKDGSTPASGPIVLSGDPVNPLDAASKQYVDRVAAGGKSLLTKNFNLLDTNLNPIHAPFSTEILATQSLSVYDTEANFSTIGHSNYSVITNTVAVDFGSTRFLYQLGGSQGTTPTEIRNVSKTSLDSNGIQSTWTSVGAPDLPEPATSTGSASVLTSSLGKHIVFAKGKGDNLLWRSQAINQSSGNYSGWDLLSPLPLNAGDPDVVILDVNGTQVAYILLNRSGGSSDLVIAPFDINGDVTGYTVNTIPQSIVGRLVALGNRLYIFGVEAFSTVLFIGDINPTTKNVTWTSSSTNLPLGLTKFGISTHVTTEGNNQVYIYGGKLVNTLQDTIYSAISNGDGTLQSFIPINAKLELPTASFGVSSVTIGAKQYVYATGGQRDSGFVDNSTTKSLVEVKTFNVVRRNIGSGSFYHVNKDESSRPAQSFIFQPTLNDDPTLSKPINVFYFARKDNSNINYQITSSLDPNFPADISDNENLLIRIDQVDPVTGNVKSMPVSTSPISIQDYFEKGKLVTHVIDITPNPVVVTPTTVTINEGAYTLGNYKKVFTNTSTIISGLTPTQTLYVYWSNFEIITSSTELDDRILLGKIIVDSDATTFTPVTEGIVYRNSNISLAANANITLFHGFNTRAITTQIWVDNGSELVLNEGIKIVQLGLNEVKIINTTSNTISLKEILIKKEF